MAYRIFKSLTPLTPAAEAEVTRQLEAAGVPATSPLPEGAVREGDRISLDGRSYYRADAVETTCVFIHGGRRQLRAECSRLWEGCQPFQTVELSGLMVLSPPPWVAGLCDCGQAAAVPVVMTTAEAQAAGAAFLAELRKDLGPVE